MKRNVCLGKSTSPRCIIHTGEEIHENIKLLFENINNCETLKVIWNAWLKNSKSNSEWDVISKDVPDIFRKNDGYHSKCYKKYTACTISAYITGEEVESKVSLCSNQYVCFVIKKEKNSKVDGSHSAAVRNLMFKQV